MKNCSVVFFCMTFIFYCCGASAHHAFITHFDPSKTFQIEGVVTEFRLRSPHAFLFVDITDENGAVQDWEIELQSGVHLRRQGASPNTFEPGDLVRVSAWPNRVAGKNLVYGTRIVAENGDTYGQRPNIAVDDYSNSASGVAAILGRWSSPIPLHNPQEPLPLNEAGSLAVENYDPQLSPATTCESPSIPDLQLSPYLTDIQIEDGEVLFLHEAYGMTRAIPLDSPAAQVEPSGQLGVASAYVDGNELVIESSGYPASRWGLSAAAQPKGGPWDVPSSTQKKVVERYSVSDDGQTLTLQYTLEDPAYLTEVYSSHLSMSRVADDEPMYLYECEVDSAKRFSD
jgi:hypothetical protein